MRALGIDLGERRIGVAVSDSAGVLASPYTVLERSGDAEHDRRAIAAIVAEVHAEMVVVGLPLTLSGKLGPAAEAAAGEAAALEAVVGVPVTTFDERLTTVEAARRRRERLVATSAGRGGTGERRGRPGRHRKAIDAEAAAVLLGAWLEARRS